VREELRRSFIAALHEAGRRDHASHIATGHNYVMIGTALITIDPLIEAAMRVMRETAE